MFEWDHMITCVCSCMVPWGGTAGECLFSCLLNESNSLLHRFIVVYWRKYSSVNFLAKVWSTSFISYINKTLTCPPINLHSRIYCTLSILVQCTVTVHPMLSETISMADADGGILIIYLKDFSYCSNLLCFSIGTLHFTGEKGHSEGLVGVLSQILTLTWQNYNTPTRCHQSKDQDQYDLMQTRTLESVFPLLEKTWH